MKTLLSILLIIGLTAHTAQSQWELLGNTGTNHFTNYVGTTDNQDLRFRTNNLPRLCLQGASGNFGIGTNTPQTKLHLEDGAFFINGSLGANPNTGAGTKLLWIPEFKAFRAGEVSGSQWDGLNVGTHSLAIGFNNTAFGNLARYPKYLVKLMLEMKKLADKLS